MFFDRVAFGKRIKKARIRKKMTQEELAGIIGVTRQYISSIERGGGTPDVSILYSICQTLGVSADELIGGIKLSNHVPSDFNAFCSDLSNDQLQIVRVVLQELSRQNREE